MRLCLCLDIPAGVLREVLSWYGVDVPADADRDLVLAAWNDAVSRRRRSS